MKQLIKAITNTTLHAMDSTSLQNSKGPQQKRKHKSYTFVFLPTLALLWCTTSFAHVEWHPSGPFLPRVPTQFSPTTPDGPTLLQSGSRIEVVYFVRVAHGGVEIEFSPTQNGSFTTLDNDVPSSAGIHRVEINLPNQECDACVLRVIDSFNYNSLGDIQLTATGLPDPDPEDTTPPEPVGNLSSEALATQISLTWSNPAEDFYQTLVLQSDMPINDQPNNGIAYTKGDAIGDATVIYAGDLEQIVIIDLMSETDYFFEAISYDESLNYSTETAITTATSVAINTAPSIYLNIMQAGVIDPSISTDAGEVIVQAITADTDGSDTLSVDWSGMDSRLTDIDNEEATFTFNPSNLTPGEYVISAEVTDNGTPPMSNVTSTTATLTAPEPEPEPEPEQEQEQEPETEAPAAVQSSQSSGGSLHWVFLAILGLTGFATRQRTSP